MKKKTFLVITITTIGLWVTAQSLSPTVISSDGAENYTTTMSLEWTLGELSVESSQTESLMLTEGYHQPLLKIMEIPNDLITKSNLDYENGQFSNININVWPNPVQSILNAQVETELDDEILIELFDGVGKKLLFKKGHHFFELIEVDLTQNPPGNYLLKFSKKDGSLIKTVLITKQ